MTAYSRRRSGEPDRVVVAVDFSAPSMAAATWVTQHVARGAEVVLVHVLHAPSMPGFLAGRYPPAQRERLIEAARAGAFARLRELSDSMATGPVWPEVRVGKPDEEIVRVAEEYGAGLVVVGRPATRAGVLGRIGTTAQRVLRRSPVPVLLAAGMPTRAPTRLLVAVDDSDMTGPVLDWGFALSDRFAAETTVMHVVSVPLFPAASVAAVGLGPTGVESPRRGPAEDERAVHDAEHWLAERLQASSKGGRITSAVVSGYVRPADAILAEAARRGAELIVVGSSGAGAVPRLLFGSVAEGALRGASCPVLVIVQPTDAIVDPAWPNAAARLPHAGSVPE